jgi:anti-sigma regulatory factor (Ser/Thr protein kinase)
VQLTIGESEAVRTDPRRFLVVRGHEGEAEDVVDRHRRFLDSSATSPGRRRAVPPRVDRSSRPVLLSVPYVGFDRAAMPATVGEARERITALAAEYGAGCRIQADVALAVSEAVANAVMHAYPPGRAGLVRVAADIEDGDLEIVVTDDGSGFRPGSSPGLGAGLSIIAQTAHEFVIRERDPHGIELWMRFQLKRDD